MTTRNTAIGPNYNVYDTLRELTDDQISHPDSQIQQLLDMHEHNEGTGTTYQGRTAEQWANTFYALYREHQEALAAIHAKQQRDKDNTRTMFAVILPDGDRKHISTDYAHTHQAKDFYDGARVGTWTETNLQYVSDTGESNQDHQ